MTDRETRSSNGRPHSWVTAVGPNDQLMNVRMEPDERGRWIVTAMLIEGGRITADLLRQVQPARIEAAVSATAGSLEATEDLDDEMTLGDLRDAHLRHLVGGVNVIAYPDPSLPAREPLSRPDGTDAWYANFADVYRATVAITQAPAVLLAAESGAPLSAVHRWVAEARRRGHLPPGRKGSAG